MCRDAPVFCHACVPVYNLTHPHAEHLHVLVKSHFVLNRAQLMLVRQSHPSFADIRIKGSQQRLTLLHVMEDSQLSRPVPGPASCCLLCRTGATAAAPGHGCAAAAAVR